MTTCISSFKSEPVRSAFLINLSERDDLEEMKKARLFLRELQRDFRPKIELNLRGWCRHSSAGITVTSCRVRDLRMIYTKRAMVCGHCGPWCHHVSADHRHGRTTKSRRGQACEKVGQTRNVDLYGYGRYTYAVRSTTRLHDGAPWSFVTIQWDGRCTDWTRETKSPLEDRAAVSWLIEIESKTRLFCANPELDINSSFYGYAELNLMIK